MVFVAGNALAPDAFASVIDVEIRQNLVPDQLLIVVRDSIYDAVNLELAANSTHVGTLARFRNRTTVTLASFNHRGIEAQRSQVMGPFPRTTVEFKHFQRRAISKIFSDRHGFIEATSTYHFRNPSGRHTERFIRLSNILVRGAEISFIGFCVLPHIPTGTRFAYLDTPSLHTVIAAVNEHLLTFGREVITADNFSSYAGAADFPFSGLKDAMVLISASSSGSLASAIKSKAGFVPERIAHLLFLGTDSSGSRLICDLQYDAKDNPEGVTRRPVVEREGDCSMCAAGSFAIPLQGDQFDFAGPQQSPLLIMKEDAPRYLRDVVDRNAGKGVFAVGINLGNGNPRTFEVSPVDLLQNSAFRARLDYALRRSVPKDLGYVISADGASNPLAQEVIDFGAGRPVLIAKEKIEDIPKGATQAVMVVAAVIESGRSLLEVSRDLRSIVPEAPISYLVGFSKSSGEARRESLSKSLVQTLNPYPYDYIEIERMILPPSIGRNAWLEERDLLSDPKTTGSAPESIKQVLEDRLKQLRKSSKAMANDLFLANDPFLVPTLQPGFVFWHENHPVGATQADVYFTVASVLQQLRANAEKIGAKQALRSNWLQQTILSAGNFGRFNDDVIQASLLRAASPFELNYADLVGESQEVSRLIRRILGSVNTARGGAATEFLLALATRRMTLRRSDLDDILSTGNTGSDMVDFMLDVCRNRLV